MTIGDVDVAEQTGSASVVVEVGEQQGDREVSAQLAGKRDTGGGWRDYYVRLPRADDRRQVAAD